MRIGWETVQLLIDKPPPVSHHPAFVSTIEPLTVLTGAAVTGCCRLFAMLNLDSSHSSLLS